MSHESSAPAKEAGQPGEKRTKKRCDAASRSAESGDGAVLRPSKERGDFGVIRRTAASKRTKRAAKTVGVKKAKPKKKASKPTQVDVQEDAQDLRHVAIDEIQPRAGGNTRDPNLDAIAELAGSISDVGLIEPLVLDCKLRLLAGLHRWLACRLLCEPDPDKRAKLLWECAEGDPAEMDEAKKHRLVECVKLLSAHGGFRIHGVPVHVEDFDSAQDPARALAVEVAESEKRKQYSRDEMRRLADRLLAAGHSAVRGRPTSAEKPLVPALATILGKSRRTIERMLNGNGASAPRDAPTEGRKAARKALRALGALETVLKAVEHEKDRGLARGVEVMRRALLEFVEE